MLAGLGYNEMELNIVANRSTGSEQGRRRRAPKTLLLVVELLAVAGLLLAAGQLWQVRQTLHEDLRMAQKVEAAIRSGETIPGAGERSTGQSGSAIDAGSGPYVSGARWQASPVSPDVHRLPALWLLRAADDGS